jgi:hypothetical protein
LEWFQFGQHKTVKDARGDTKEVGEYALHVQCAWLIRHSDQVVVASGDLYYPATQIDEYSSPMQGNPTLFSAVAEWNVELVSHLAYQTVVHPDFTRGPSGGVLSAICDSDNWNIAYSIYAK